MDFLSIYDMNISGFTGFRDLFFTFSLFVFYLLFCVKEMSLIQIRDMSII